MPFRKYHRRDAFVEEEGSMPTVIPYYPARAARVASEHPEPAGWRSRETFTMVVLKLESTLVSLGGTTSTCSFCESFVKLF